MSFQTCEHFVPPAIKGQKTLPLKNRRRSGFSVKLEGPLKTNRGLCTNGYEVNSVDKFSKRKRSEIMGKVRSRGNATTELKTMRILRAAGITGWRRHLPIFGRPDFTFPKNRVALFIDGCFWHGCPQCYQAPKSSIKFWREKISRNGTRDKEVSRRLRKSGWKVVRVWECRLKSPRYLLRRIRKLIPDKSK
jgi:DNA mismatch endonuclease (patch repair protein)